MDMRVRRGDGAEHLRDRFEVSIQLAAPKSLSAIAVLFQEQSAGSTGRKTIGRTPSVRSELSRSRRCRSVPPPQRWLKSRKTARSSLTQGRARIRRTRDRSARLALNWESLRLASERNPSRPRAASNRPTGRQIFSSRLGRLRRRISVPAIRGRGPKSRSWATQRRNLQSERRVLI